MDLKCNSCYLLLDVGGTFVKSGAATPAGVLLPEAEFTHPIRSEGTREEIEESLATVVRRGTSFAHNNGLTVAGIGIAIPGPFDYAAGVPRMQHKFQSVYGVSLRAMLQALPDVGERMSIRFVHDVNAMLLGEMTAGNASGFPDAALVALGTGLGFACCRDAQVQYSPTGSPLISIYAHPYRDGILEDFVSKRGFLRTYGEIAGECPEELTAAQIGRLAGEGNTAALRTFDAVGRILGGALRELLREQRIGCLLFGGQISRSFGYMERALREELHDVPTLRRITQIKHIDEATFHGLCRLLNEA